MTSRCAAVLAVFALAFLTACGGTTDQESDRSAESKSAAEQTPAEPAYRGTPPPGLNKEPVWSKERAGAPYVIGDVVAVSPKRAGGDMELYDLESGELTGDVIEPPEEKDGIDRRIEDVRTATWKGEPALLRQSMATKESDGLSEAKKYRVIDVYGRDGNLIHSASEQDIGTSKFDVVNGWIVRNYTGEHSSEDRDNQDAAIITPDGDIAVESICEKFSLLECAVNTTEGRSEYTGESFPTVIGDVAFLKEPRGERGQGQGSRLVAIDLTTGDQLWNSDDIESPSETPNDLDRLNAYPAAAVGDSGVILHWPHETAEASIAVHDLQTGELTVTGPTIDVLNDSSDESAQYLIDENADIAVVPNSPTAGKSAAFELSTGELLWQQKESESDLRAESIVGDVLYGYRAEKSEEPIAVRAEDKEVLLEDFGSRERTSGDKTIPVPVAVPGTQTALVDGNGGLFLFPTTSAGG